MITIPSVINISSAYKDNLYSVTEKRIIEAATLCIKEENCEGNKVTLKTLYEQNYLTEEYNPVTKEIYNEDSYVSFYENETVFISK